MLQKLHILNYAIIDEIAVDFSKNLNIITGETGAGKSILLGALGLILGERADSSTLMNKEKKCVVEGHFSAKKNPAVKIFLSANELDHEEELVLRREIAVNGKSRAFINDTPVNLNQLKELSSLLVDLHQQFDALELGDHDFQREVLDALAGNTSLLQEYNGFFSRYILITKQLSELQKQQQEANATLDYNQFLFDELADANFKENELEEAEAELKLLSHAEEVKQQLGNIYFELKESEQPLLPQLKSLLNKLHSLEQFHPAIMELTRRLQSAQLELDDIADGMLQVNDTVQYHPERLQLINEKISIGYRMQKKHNVTTTNELLQIKELLQAKLADILNVGEAIAEKETEAGILLNTCLKMAAAISANRCAASAPFAEKVNLLLKQVGMPNALIKIDIIPTPISPYGIDTISFLFDANKTNRFESLSKVASGGELSRLMLCIKSLVAKKLQLPTLIFDEIDSGISGEAAKQAGVIMKELSIGHQVIAITHQPQIAAKATAHYFVYKEKKGDKINTAIRLLNDKERVEAIAQMLGGEKPTAAALMNAREMIGMPAL